MNNASNGEEFLFENPAENFSRIGRNHVKVSDTEYLAGSLLYCEGDIARQSTNQNARVMPFGMMSEDEYASFTERFRK